VSGTVRWNSGGVSGKMEMVVGGVWLGGDGGGWCLVRWNGGGWCLVS